METWERGRLDTVWMSSTFNMPLLPETTGIAWWSTCDSGSGHLCLIHTHVLFTRTCAHVRTNSHTQICMRTHTETHRHTQLHWNNILCGCSLQRTTGSASLSFSPVFSSLLMLMRFWFNYQNYQFNKWIICNASMSFDAMANQTLISLPSGVWIFYRYQWQFPIQKTHFQLRKMKHPFYF